MNTLLLSPEMKRRIQEKLERIPRPEFLCGKVTVSFEFNCRPDGSLGDLYIDTQVREVRKA